MIEIKNVSKSGFSAKSFSQVAKNVLKSENKEITRLSVGRKIISLAFISKKEIQALNKKFRSKNKPTDVLSFLLDEGDYLGEIVICPEVVKRKEMMKVFIHGILHLLGYDHEISEDMAKIMEEKQNFYLSKFKL